MRWVHFGATSLICAAPLLAQVLHYADLNTRQIENLDRARTVLILPGSATVRPEILRAVFMDLADQLGNQRFRWILIVHDHGDPAHNRMLDDAGDYLHDRYRGEMVNLFGYLWAMDLTDFRTLDERQKDGRPEHATITETSVILALPPSLVAADFKSAAPQAGSSMPDLQRIASAPGWPGYFASPALGRRIYDEWLERSKDLVARILAGEDHRKLQRLGDLGRDDPADAAARTVKRRFGGASRPR